MMRSRTYLATVVIGLVMYAGLGAGRESSSTRAEHPTIETHQCESRNLPDCSEQCELGHGGSCATLGVMYVNGSGVTRDEARGAELYRSACDLGSAEGCYALYSALLYGVGTPTDSRAALVAAEKACTLGHQDSCRIVELNDRFSKR